jgi:hypothetical protein
MDVQQILQNIETASAKGFANIGKTFDTMQITTTNDVKSNRLSICADCSRFDKQLSRCQECGCFMQLKATLSHARCPLDKW